MQTVVLLYLLSVDAAASPARSEYGALAQLVARNVRNVEVRGSNPLCSTRWTLHEHLLFQRRLCCHGVAVMSTTEKQGSRLGALPLAFLLFVFLLLLPLGELLLPLFAVIIFSYLWDKETGKGLYDGLWKLNIISLLPDFLICHSVYLPNIQFSRCKSIPFYPSFLRCLPLLDFPPHFRRDFADKLP